MITGQTPVKDYDQDYHSPGHSNGNQGKTEFTNGGVIGGEVTDGFLEIILE
jgi:hypothetical protein